MSKVEYQLKNKHEMSNVTLLLLGERIEVLRVFFRYPTERGWVEEEFLVEIE